MNNPQKRTGLINRTDTSGVITWYPLNDLNLPVLVASRAMSGFCRKGNGAERVSGLFILT